MECIICDRKYDDHNGRARYCKKCGVELLDNLWTESLEVRRANIAEASRKLIQLNQRGELPATDYDEARQRLAADYAEIEAQEALVEGEKQNIKARFVKKQLALSGELMRHGQLGYAREALDPALKVEPADPELHLQMARILAACQNPDEALRAAKYALYLDPSNIAIEEYVSQLETLYDDWHKKTLAESRRGSAMSPPARPDFPPAPQGSQAPTAASTASPPPIPPVTPKQPRPPAPPKPPDQPAPPKPPKPPKPPVPERQRPDFGNWISGLVEKGLLRWWYFVGTFILLAGVAGLVTWQWNVVGKYFVFGTVTAVTAGLYALGHFLSKRIRLGSTIIFAIASILVPIDFYLFYRLSDSSIDPNLLGIAGAIIAAVIYAVNFYKTRDQVLVAFMSLTPLGLLFFILRSSGVSVRVWGLWFVGLVACYFAASYIFRRAGLRSYSRTLFAVGNATIVLALLTTIGDIRYFVGAGMRTSGILLVSSAVALLIGSYAYDDKVLPYVSSVLILASSFFMVREPGTAWYLATPALAISAGVLILLGFIDSKVRPEQGGRPYVYTGVAAILAILAASAGKDFLFNIPRAWTASPSIEVRNSLITAAIASGLLWVAALLERKKLIGYLAAAATIYASLIGLGYWSGSLPTWCLIEATVVAGGLLGIGFALEKLVGDDWGPVGYIPGFVVAGASTVAAAIFYLPTISLRIIPELAVQPNALAGAVCTALVMTAYLIAATLKTRQAGALYGACSSLAIAGIFLAHSVSHSEAVRTLSGHGVNYGMLLLPLAVVFGLAGHLLMRSGRDEMALPPLIAFGLVSAFSFGSQVVYMAGGASFAAAITLGALGIIAAIETALWKRGEFIYPGAAAVILCAAQLLALGLRGSGIELNYMLLLTPLAAALAIGGAAMVGYGKGEKYGIPMLLSGAAFAATGFVYELVRMAQGMTYSPWMYMLGWSLVAGACATFFSLTADEGGWRGTLPTVAVSASLVHLALGVGWMAWTLSHSFPVVAFSLAGLGIALSVARASRLDTMPSWLEQPMLVGAICVGVASVACSLQVRTFGLYYANVAAVLALAMTLFVQGFLKRDRVWMWVSIGSYATATLVSYCYMVGSNAGAVTHAAMIWQCASLAIASALSIAVSEMMEDVFAHAAGHVFALLGWSGLGWILGMYPSYAGYWFGGAAMVLAATSFISYTRDLDKFTDIGLIAATGFFAASIIQPMILGLRTEAIVTMSMALAASAACVFLYGREKLAYIPLGISAFETVYILATLKPHTGPESLAGLVLLGPAIAYLGLAWLVRRDRGSLSDIFLQFAAGFTVMSTVAEIVVLFRSHGAPESGGMLMVAALFVAASIYAAIAVLKDWPWVGHLSFAHFFFGYVLILVNGQVSMPHLYCLPAGIYIIALGYWAERVGYSKRTVQILHLVGFTILAMSSLVPSMREQGGWNAAILLTESVAAIGLAFWQRRKVFLGAGLTFIVVDGIVKLWTPASSLHWSVYAVLVGALVIVGGILFETRRELLLEKGTDVIQTLKMWK